MATPNPNVTVNDAEIEAFQREGAVVLRGLFNDWMEPLREGVDTLIASPSPLERSYQPSDGSAPFFQDLCNWQRIEPFSRFVMESSIAELACKLMGSRQAQFFHDHVLVKEPGSSQVTPWHQDQPYYCVESTQCISFWIPLDPVACETSLKCIAGSHHWNKLHRPKRFDGSDLYQGDTREELPDIDVDPSQYRILQWALEPGDAVAFDFRTVHGASANTSSHRRRVFSARWLGDNARFVDRGGKGSPPFAHLTLQNGDLLTGPEFPIVYQHP
ncbi:hypothetical protein LCGC14_0055890 [marine sediment metagenome]|uniref:Phytanoyl-CoA dioxygenase n=1 Tax=marine sediment metagenome TaxID=412755 RepID=A0A0F9W5U0_9ZZZZ|nr:phytanoyl-CoA dioxygenase family protein [Halomonas sp.]HDZ46205.1 phytanoyl-CoA dioxygenase [Halomonas sp.]HEB03238.1 phytanoyl-CoA dioxygenase [Halomonas sp.]